MVSIPCGLKTSLLITDIGFLSYWTLTALAAAGVLTIPAEYLYSDYHNPAVVAWNWSFMPLDVVLSMVGITAVTLQRRACASWRPLALVSLSLTICAGLMAISFWAMRGEFDWAWWTINLALVLWPLYFLPQLIKAD
jgi:hypothetical protein